MHIPKIFEQPNQAALKELITSKPFATLISHTNNGLEADHIPFIFNTVENKDVLQGHIAKINPLWQNLAEGTDVLAIFHGPHHYISPNYYPTKKDNGRAVPTWNYVVAHVRGKISYRHDLEWNLNMLTKLSEQEEQAQTTPWQLSDAPKDFTDKLVNAIVGIEIEISSIVGQWKLSQNQPSVNKQGVIKGLSEQSNSYALDMVQLIKNQIKNP